jgi:hypothetical protein
MKEEREEEEIRQDLAAFIDERGIISLRDGGGWAIRAKKDISNVQFAVMNEKVHALGGKLESSGIFTIKQLQSKEAAGQPQFARVPLAKLIAGYQPRRVQSKEDLEKYLRRREKLYLDMHDNGQKQKLIVRPSKKVEGSYEVIKGNTRLEFAKQLANDKTSHFDWTSLDVEIRELSDEEVYQLVAQLFDREDLDQFEWGRLFKKGLEEYPDLYPNQTAIAKAFGYKTHSQVSQLISFYEEEQAKIDTQNRVENRVDAAKNDSQPDCLPANILDGKDVELLPVPTPEHAKIIRSAPAELKSELTLMAAEGASKRNLQNHIKSKQQPTTPQEEYAEQEAQEEQQKQALINGLKNFVSDSDLRLILERFNRVQYGCMTNSKLTKICVQLINELKPGFLECQREGIAATIEEAKHTPTAFGKSTRLEEAFRKIEEDL